ncbi:MAG TPA: YmaF family protein [Clostridia bacterium]|nr:YmaF family protein [Clostridia bacterium]
MPRELHDHLFNGRTTIEDQHRHRFMGTTSENPDTPRHTHIMAGNTDFRQRHRHRFRIRTSPPIPFRGGHVHYFYGITSINDGHFHYMFGYTRVHRNDDYGTYQDYFGTESEQIDSFEE